MQTSEDIPKINRLIPVTAYSIRNTQFNLPGVRLHVRSKYQAMLMNKRVYANGNLNNNANLVA